MGVVVEELAGPTSSWPICPSITGWASTWWRKPATRCARSGCRACRTAASGSRSRSPSPRPVPTRARSRAAPSRPGLVTGSTVRDLDQLPRPGPRRGRGRRDAQPARARDAAFYVPLDLPGVTTGLFEDLGCRGLTRGWLNLTDVELPRRNRIGAEGDGFRLVVGIFDLHEDADRPRRGRRREASLDATVAYARTRKTSACRSAPIRASPSSWPSTRRGCRRPGGRATAPCGCATPAAAHRRRRDGQVVGRDDCP